MDYFDTRYMNKNKWTDKAQSIFNDEIIHTECPQMCKINRGIILPQKDGVLPWGIGGCLNENKELVKTSTVSGAYGAKYAYDEQSLEYIDETVILIPIIPKQWGHFIIDVVSRLWFALEDEYSNYKIYYCAWGFEEGKLAGNYKKYLDYLGIFERMIYVSHPIQAKEVLIPEYTMSFADTCNEHFKDVNDVVVEKIMECEVVKTLQRYDKVYFFSNKASDI